MAIEKINILLVDDHSMVIEGMKAILAQVTGVQVKAIAGTAAAAMEALQTNTIHIAFVDINLPDRSGIELCAAIKRKFPALHVLGLSTFKQRSYVSQMINNGASGYLLKSADKEEIQQAIKDVLGGKMFFSTAITSASPAPAAASDEAPTLTRREKEILQLIAQGATTNDIAAKLFVSPYTVDTHRKNLLAKFEVGNTALLIKTAASLGLV